MVLLNNLAGLSGETVYITWSLIVKKILTFSLELSEKESHFWNLVTIFCLKVRIVIERL